MRENAEKDVRNIGESELPRIASSGYHCSTTKRKKVRLRVANSR
jgi:hypothetical protein